MSSPKGPPFTVPRYGSLGESIIAERDWLKGALREVYEVWAGSDGFVPQTAAEGYQQRLILQMRDAAARGLGKTISPQSEPK